MLQFIFVMKFINKVISHNTLNNIQSDLCISDIINCFSNTFRPVRRQFIIVCVFD